MKSKNVFFCYSENQESLDKYLLNKVYKDKKIKTFFVEGRECINELALYKEFSEALSFPDYFGENWDAFDECMNDLDWLQEKEIVVVILNSDKLFNHVGELENKQIFWKIIKRTIWVSPEEKYSNPVHVDQPRTIFVLQSSDQEFLNNISQYMQCGE